MDEPADDIDATQLIHQAREGDATAVAQLLEHYRPYLMMLARLRSTARLQSRYDDSDLVQETLLNVHRDLVGFRGTTEAAFTAWLRRIMATVSSKHVRHHTRQRRSPDAERQLEESFSRSSHRIGRTLAAPDSSPSERSVRRERAVILARALTELPADYREALIANRLEGLTISQTAERMGRSIDSVQKLLARGLMELRRRLEGRL